jgi:rubrerythrin
MTTLTAGVRPSYLGLLNAIVTSELHGHEYFTAWLEKTDDPEVRTALLAVRAREGEHGMTFARRINELGFEVRPRPLSEDEIFRAEVAGSDRSDEEKLAALGYGEGWGQQSGDLYDHWFADHTIDPVTGGLLGRFIAEERDSSRLLRGAWEAVSGVRV